MNKPVINKAFETFYSSLLRSFSQIMLQENSSTGLLVLIGIALNSASMLLAGVLATCSALLVAKLCQFDVNLRSKGLFGYNAALVGIAISYLLPLNLTFLVLTVFAAVISTLIMQLMTLKLARIPAFTAPFLLTIWLVMIFIDYAGLILVDRNSLVSTHSAGVLDYLYATVRGVGQVVFQDNWFSGVVIVAALLIHSISSAVWALVGSLVAVIIANYCHFPQEVTVMGLYGFNSCLVAIVLAERYPKKYWLIVLGCILTVFITRLFELSDIPALTAPFVLTAWLIISIVTMTTDKNNV